MTDARRRATAVRRLALCACASAVALACTAAPPPPTPTESAVRPLRATAPVPGDSDDPAIWFHPTDPAQSLLVGTDKGGGLYVFDLAGRPIPGRSMTGLARPNNVDIEQNVLLDGRKIDLAVVTERDGGRVRVFELPALTPIDGGGVEVFAGESGDRKAPMGVGLYLRPTDGALFAFVSRKFGPADGYLWQYRIAGDGAGGVRFTKVRTVGAFSGRGEIEAILVDDALGYVYYSDEWKGIRKYAADPDAPDANRELALFGTADFREDREGLSLYALDAATGYLLASDQQANSFRVYPREGTASGGPHDHPELAVIPVSTIESDGSETTSRPLGPDFPHGLFVAMSEDKTFQLYRWEDLADEKLKLRTTP